MNTSSQAPPAAVQWIVWAAILASVFVYAAIPIFLPVGPGPSEVSGTAVVGTFGLMALLCAVSSLAVRRLMLVAPLERGELDLSERAGRARFFQVSIICWVLTEAVAIWGLVLFFLGSSELVLYGFVLGAALLLGVHAPRLQASASATIDLAKPDVKIG